MKLIYCRIHTKVLRLSFIVVFIGLFMSVDSYTAVAANIDGPNTNKDNAMASETNKNIIPDRITLKNGKGNLPYLELRFKRAEAHLYLNGAHILHYQPAGHEPVLWHSKSSWFEPGKPIRGGIPVCWPWFGAHPTDPEKPGHGVARIAEWEMGEYTANDKATTVTLKLPESAYPNASVQLTVELSDQLSIALTTANTGDTDLQFEEILHSYFAVADIDHVTVNGLEGQQYMSQLAPNDPLKTQRGPITFTAETDRIYTDKSQNCTLVDSKLNRSIHISKENSLSTVVWNPWIDKSIRMPDFGAGEFKGMVCVETGNCGANTITLSPGKTHTLQLNIRVESKCK